MCNRTVGGRAWILTLLGGCVGGAAVETPAAEGPGAVVSPPIELGAAALRVRAGAAGAVTVGAEGREGVTFRTVSSVAPRVAVEADGALALDRGEVVERWRSSGDGVEQSWTFARSPGGAATVRVRVDGARYEGATRAGLRFVDVATGAALRYGAATWVDARGARTPVDERVEGDTVVLTVPAEVIARSAFPAVLDPTVSAELVVEPTVLTSRTRSLVGRATVASNGTDSLAVWQDSRVPAGVYAARLTAAGVVRDPANLFVAGAGVRPVVASDGAGFLVAWVGADRQAHWSRVDAAGAVLDPGGVARAGSLLAGELALAFDGTNYLLAWSAPAGSPGAIRVARVARDGRLLDAAGAEVSSGSTDRRNPAIAAGAGGALVAWEDFRSGSGLPTVYAARVRADGVVIDPDGRVVSLAAANQTQPSVATDGASFLVAWYARNGAGSRAPGPYAALVGPAGTTLAINPLWPSPGTDVATDPAAVAAAYSGGRYLVTWTGGQPRSAPGLPYHLLPRIYAVRVDAAGAPLDATPREVARIDTSMPTYPTFFLPAVAGRPGGFQLLWAYQESPLGVRDVQGVATDLDAVPAGEASQVEMAPADQTSPQVTATPSGYFVGWIDYGQTLPQFTFRARGARLSPSGTVLDSPALSLVPQETAIAMTVLRLATVGASSLAAWRQTGDPQRSMVLVPAVGAPVVTATVAQSGLIAGLAAARTNALLVTRVGMSSSLQAQRVGLDGRVLDAFPLPLPPFNDADVVSDGTNFLVVGTLIPSGCTGTCPGVAFLRVSGAGDLLDASPVFLSASARPPSDYSLRQPAAAFDGARYLLTWRGGGATAAVVEVHGARVGADGAVLDATPIVVSGGVSGNKQSPVVTYDGATWVAAWADARGGNSVYAARVTGTGAVLDPAGVAIATGLVQPAAVDIASTGAGLSAVVYTRRATASAPMRVVARMLSFGDGGVVDAGSATDSGAALDAGTDVSPADVGATDAGVADVGVDVGVADLPALDLGAATDVGSPTDVRPPTDVVSPSDTSSPTDVVSPSDTSSPTDVVSPTDTGSPTDVPTAASPQDDGGLCEVGGAAGARRAGTPWALVALGLVGSMRRWARRSSPRPLPGLG